MTTKKTKSATAGSTPREWAKDEVAKLATEASDIIERDGDITSHLHDTDAAPWHTLCADLDAQFDTLESLVKFQRGRIEKVAEQLDSFIEKHVPASAQRRAASSASWIIATRDLKTLKDRMSRVLNVLESQIEDAAQMRFTYSELAYIAQSLGD